MDRRGFLKFLGLAPAAAVPAAAVAAPVILAPAVDAGEIGRLNAALEFQILAREAEHRAFAEVISAPGVHHVVRMSMDSTGDHPIVKQVMKQLEES